MGKTSPAQHLATKNPTENLGEEQDLGSEVRLWMQVLGYVNK